MPFVDVVQEAVQFHAASADTELKDSDSPLKTQDSIPRRSPRTRRATLSDSPALRTGPPRSISYNYSVPQALGSASNQPSQFVNGSIPEAGPEAEGTTFPFHSQGHDVFRGALEFNSPERRAREKQAAEKKREGRLLDASWNPIKRFHETPKDEKAGFALGDRKDEDQTTHRTNQRLTMDGRASSSQAPEMPSRMQRSISLPHNKPDRPARGTARWSRLRSLLPTLVGQGKSMPGGQAAITPQNVNITDELMIGGLSTLMLRLWFERDEKDRRRVPILFHRLRIRISDSLHPMHGHKSVFRIECEYANGAARWVIYRQLRDFISLHTHYTFSNAYNRNIETMPEFPLTSIPYFKFLKKESHDNRDGQLGHADFARMQREALENYLINLIRAVMFHPTANRLAGFLEISALSISLAQTGGCQAKAGYLRIESAGNKGGGFGRKSAGWVQKKQLRWCAVRDSYLVVLDQPGELTVWDVFLLDSDFKIERPTRYYRQGLNLLHPTPEEKNIVAAKGDEKAQVQHKQQNGFASAMGTITSRMSGIFRPGHHNHDQFANGEAGSSHTRAGSVFSDSSNSSETSGEPTPMLDPSTNVNPLEHPNDMNDKRTRAGEGEQQQNKKHTGDVSKHTFYIENSQMRLKLFARNERQMLQWITALEKVAASSLYAGRNRFDSFAPMRTNVAAQWLVDGRDYFWNLSRAILLARETIYIHDWWLSPELQLRRPNKPKYRIDKLLERKAKEGVKIYIIVYQEVSNKTTPVDSNYTKQRLTGLHKNIMVQRSPSHFQTGTFYWAHHEKLCAVDETIAFIGGLDLCFGRWDTPQHVIIDDTEVGPEPSEIWPGKDYSNPRILDFHTLNRPEESMYDRSKTPRMPWHDVGMQVVGQPARDLCRHFVQRWNFLLRIKNHSRVMPFLLPPPEFKPGELATMGLTGTCELQICRSAGSWSMGTPDKVEHSIQNAYLKAIQMSEHFVYIENQFFITSTMVNDVEIKNRIGDALVHRIIRAHREGTAWKCCIVIPLLPGFPFPVDHGDASALRIILECQNRTLVRGPNSIFSRIRREGIDPDDYISIFSLRNWAKMRGDVLTTEMVYIHGKICVVDDRLAIIGSANINERSQRGERDSELAAVIRDTDMIDGSMAGKPFKVGRFAHTLRMRLMREHIGVDVDAMSGADLMASETVKPEHGQWKWDPDAEQERSQEVGVTQKKKSQQRTPASVIFHNFADALEQVHGTGEAGSGSAAKAIRNVDLKSKGLDATAPEEVLKEERIVYAHDSKKVPGFADGVMSTLEERIVESHIPQELEANNRVHLEDSVDEDDQHVVNDSPEQACTEDRELFGAPVDPSKSSRYDDQPPPERSGVVDASDQGQAVPRARATSRKDPAGKSVGKAWTLPTPTPKVDPQGFEDPISDSFWKDVWTACAIHNTEIYRKVFHAVPDDNVTTWKQYKEFVAHHDRSKKPTKDQGNSEPVACIPSKDVDNSVPVKQAATKSDSSDKGSGKLMQEDSEHRLDGQVPSNGSCTPNKDSGERKPARGLDPFELWEREEMEQLLAELRGHLVMYPTRFLEGEDVADNLLFNADRLLPLLIYD